MSTIAEITLIAVTVGIAGYLLLIVAVLVAVHGQVHRVADALEEGNRAGARLVKEASAHLDDVLTRTRDR